MNRSASRQKRSLGKDSPLSKRPKLDFTLRRKDSFNDGKDSNNGSFETPVKDTANTGSLHNKVNQNYAIEPDWDDDFSGDMLEKVCLIADLSQAMVNNQGVTDRVEKSKVQLFKGADSSTGLHPDEPKVEEVEKLRLELEQLKEKFKTKEGEVHILRSQLKQNEDTKHAAALQNIKVIEDIKKKYNEKISMTEKELETTKTKLQFKDMEYKTLSDRCRQLEYNLTKNKVNDFHSTQICSNLTQASQSVFQKNEADNDITLTLISNIKRSNVLSAEFPLNHHEGKYLEHELCPEIFEFIEEQDATKFYMFGSGKICYRAKSDFQKSEKHKWNNLPKQKIFIKNLYGYVTSLFKYENFNNKETIGIVEKILDHCENILNYNKEVLQFLEKTQIYGSEYDDSDKSLLENEDEVKILMIKTLLQGKRLNEEECGIEARRSLALIYSLMTASQIACDLVKNKFNFFKVLKILATTIGSIRRPLRYTGVLVGIVFILQRLLLEKTLSKEILEIINDIVEEIIFSRPKLDVLIEVVNALAAGKNHFIFMSALCRKASIDSCSLYMDSKLKQTMFFSKSACPLKLLCMQIMGLACLKSSKNIRWDLTNAIIKWLNSSIDSSNYRKIKWLPINSLKRQEDRCFDVTECLLYLLTLCVKDYNMRFSGEDIFYEEEKTQISCSLEPEYKRRNLLSTIGHGAVLLKRILKADQRQLHDNSYSIRFAVLLNSLTCSKIDVSENSHLSQLSSVQKEAITWLIDSLESDLGNQDYFLKQSTSAIPEADFLSALKIDEESRIY